MVSHARVSRLLAVWIVASAGCGGSDVGVSSGSASDSATGTGAETEASTGVSLTGAGGSGETSGSESSSGAMTDVMSTGAEVVCGDDDVGGTEVCDGTDLAGEDCVSQGFDAGELACAAGCDAFDTSACVSCGNDAIEGAEVCDGSDLAGEDCVSQGFDAGELACAADCSGFDTSMCATFSGACCEEDDTPGCDDDECTAAVCADDPACCSGGWDAACAAAAFDDPACVDAGGSCPACGDDVAQGGEACDGGDLLAQDCTTAGFDTGTLGCLGDCSDVDTTGCLDYSGDCCAEDATPGCDDDACTASVCANDPSCCDGAWDAACAAAAFDDPTCLNAGGSCPACGDDIAEGPEACDGADLLGDDCTDHGFDGGTLQCSVDCSGLDLTTCANVGFGDCVNNPPVDVCLATEQCVTDLAMPPTVGVCADVDCMTAADCPLAPPGGDAPVVCFDVTGEGINECVLNCALGQTCPNGMQCELGFACAWPAN